MVLLPDSWPGRMDEKERQKEMQEAGRHLQESRVGSWLLVLCEQVLSLEGSRWWLSGKEFTCQRRRHGFDSWVRKIPWRGKWQPTPVFLPGKPHGQRSLVGLQFMGSQRIKQDPMPRHTHWVLSTEIAECEAYSKPQGTRKVEWSTGDWTEGSEKGAKSEGE